MPRSKDVWRSVARTEEKMDRNDETDARNGSRALVYFGLIGSE